MILNNLNYHKEVTMNIRMKNLSKNRDGKSESASAEDVEPDSDLEDLDEPLNLSVEACLQDIKSLQKSIIQALNKSYTKSNVTCEFRMFNQLEQLCRQVFYDVKKPIATNLKLLCKFNIESPTQLAFFISYYRYINKINLANDPEGMFDKLRGKFLGGTLGEILYQHMNSIDDFEVQIRRLVNDTQRVISMLTLLQGQKKGFNCAKYITGEFILLDVDELPEQSFHVNKINRLKELLTQPHNEIEALDTDEKPPFSVHELIEINRKHRMKLDAADLIINSKLPEFNNKKELIIYFVQREIINHFKTCLLAEEKDLFWNWLVRATIITKKNNRKESALLKEGKEYYDHWENNEFTSLLNNKKIIEDLDVLMDKTDLINNNEIDKIFFNHIKKNLGELNDLLRDNGTWKLISDFDEANWCLKLEKLINKELRTPLNYLYKLMGDFDNNYDHVQEKNISYDSIKKLVNVADKISKELTEIKETIDLNISQSKEVEQLSICIPG